MKPSIREELIEAMEQAFIWAGAKDFDSGMAQFREILDSLLRKQEPMRSREHLAQLLDEMPEPTWLQIRFMKGLFRYLPQVLKYGVRELGRRLDEEVPPLPTGRPGLDAYSKARIVAEVSRKQLRGCTLKQAKIRTARQFNVSFSTVQRAWDDRGNRDEVDFKSVIGFLSDEGALFDNPGAPAQE